MAKPASNRDRQIELINRGLKNVAPKDRGAALLGSFMSEIEETGALDDYLDECERKRNQGRLVVVPRPIYPSDDPDLFFPARQYEDETDEEIEAREVAEYQERKRVKFQEFRQREPLMNLRNQKGDTWNNGVPTLKTNVEIKIDVDARVASQNQERIKALEQKLLESLKGSGVAPTAASVRATQERELAELQRAWIENKGLGPKAEQAAKAFRDLSNATGAAASDIGDALGRLFGFDAAREGSKSSTVFKSWGEASESIPKVKPAVPETPSPATRRRRFSFDEDV